MKSLLIIIILLEVLLKHRCQEHESKGKIFATARSYKVEKLARRRKAVADIQTESSILTQGSRKLQKHLKTKRGSPTEQKALMIIPSLLYAEAAIALI